MLLTVRVPVVEMLVPMVESAFTDPERPKNTEMTIDPIAKRAAYFLIEATPQTPELRRLEATVIKLCSYFTTERIIVE